MKINWFSREAKNNTLMKSKLLISVLIISIISVCFLVPGSLIINAQNEKKTLTFARTINSPLKIIELKVAGISRKFNEDFDAEAEWVKNLTFKLENISGKPIVYLKVNINFPETRATGELMSYAVSFGQRPGSKLKQNNSPLLLKAGESLEVSLLKEKERISQFVDKRRPIDSITKVELELSFIVFEDTSAWSVGSIMRQDPQNPDRYNPEPPR